MRFLQASVQQNQRRINLEDLLLLLLRCLLLIFLALALARPTLRNAAAGFGQPVTAVIALDNSYSMSATDGRFVALRQGQAGRRTDRRFPAQRLDGRCAARLRRGARGHPRADERPQPRAQDHPRGAR